MKRTPYISTSLGFAHLLRRRALSWCSYIILLAFLANTFGPIPGAQAQEFRLPVPGVMVHLSPPLNPPILKGIKVYPDNPFKFDFILDVGDASKPSLNGRVMNPPLQQESAKLIKYFLASLTIPENDLWVNLSPYEKDRVIPKSFGLTEMGRDLLAEDYVLKQITASLIYPDDRVGKKFWKRIYEEASKRYGTTDIPVNTFNKVWIVPDKAVVFENVKAGTAYVIESKLKVMLEQDYLSLKNNVDVGAASKPAQIRDGLEPSPTITNQLGSQIVREIVIPELTREVNENKNFAQLRQVYNSLILAAWYKNKIKDSILTQVYEDKSKTAGVQYSTTVIPAKAGIHSKNDVEGLYQAYLQAFKKGVYNYIKEEPVFPFPGGEGRGGGTIARKYFSGGVQLNVTNLMASAMIVNPKKLTRAIRSYLSKSVGLFLVASTLSIGGSFSPNAASVGSNHNQIEVNNHSLSSKTNSAMLNNFVQYKNEYDTALARPDFQGAVGEVIRHMVLDGNESEFGLTNNRVSPVSVGTPTEVESSRGHYSPLIAGHSHPVHIALDVEPYPSTTDIKFWKDHGYPFGIIIFGQVGQGFSAFVYDISRVDDFDKLSFSEAFNREIVKVYHLQPVTYGKLSEDEEFDHIANHQGLRYQFESASINNPLQALQLATLTDKEALKRNKQRRENRWRKFFYRQFTSESFDRLLQHSKFVGNSDLFRYATFKLEDVGLAALLSRLEEAKVRNEALFFALQYKNPDKERSPSGAFLQAIQSVRMALNLNEIFLSRSPRFGIGRSAEHGFLSPDKREQILEELLKRQMVRTHSERIIFEALRTVTVLSFGGKYDTSALLGDLGTDQLKPLAQDKVSFAQIASKSAVNHLDADAAMFTIFMKFMGIFMRNPTETPRGAALRIDGNRLNAILAEHGKYNGIEWNNQGEQLFRDFFARYMEERHHNVIQDITHTSLDLSGLWTGLQGVSPEDSFDYISNWVMVGFKKLSGDPRREAELAKFTIDVTQFVQVVLAGEVIGSVPRNYNPDRHSMISLLSNDGWNCKAISDLTAVLMGLWGARGVSVVTVAQDPNGYRYSSPGDEHAVNLVRVGRTVAYLDRGKPPEYNKGIVNVIVNHQEKEVSMADLTLPFYADAQGLTIDRVFSVLEAKNEFGDILDRLGKTPGIQTKRETTIMGNRYGIKIAPLTIDNVMGMQAPLKGAIAALERLLGVSLLDLSFHRTLEGRIRLLREMLQYVQKSDQAKQAAERENLAMLTPPRASPEGGIDLTPANMHLKMKNNGGEIKFNLDPAMLQRLKNTTGFTPVILSVKPMIDLTAFLGLTDTK